MKATAIGLIACLMVIALVSACVASNSRGYQTLEPGPKMALHIEPRNAKQGCATLPEFADFSELTRMETGTSLDYHVFLVMYDYGVGGFTGIEYGLSWPAAWGYGTTTNCADLVIGDIVDPYDGISLTWSACQDSPAVFVAAWTWLYATEAGQIQVEYRPAEPKFLGMTDCAFLEVDAESIYFAGVDVTPGAGKPDPEHAVEPTTWGNIKAMFK